MVSLEIIKLKIMKRIMLFIILFVVPVSKGYPSGKPIQQPLFECIKQFDYFFKATVIDKKVEIDSFGYYVVFLVLNVKESFKGALDDTICIGPIKYNAKKIFTDNFQTVFMDIKVNSIYYFGLDRNYYLSPFLSSNKVEIVDGFLDYKCFTKFDYYLICNFNGYLGHMMSIEKFEKKIRRKFDTSRKFEKK
jgi:hypothetical protein